MRTIGNLLSKYTEGVRKNNSLKKNVLFVVNKHIPDSLTELDFKLGRRNTIHLSVNVGGALRSEIKLHKTAILRDLNHTQRNTFLDIL